MTDDDPASDPRGPPGDSDGPAADPDGASGDSDAPAADPDGAPGNGDVPAATADGTPGVGDDPENDADEILEDLFAVIEDRKARLPEGSYTAELFDHEKGENALLEKLGEETTELVLAAKDDDREAIAHESADLVYHLLVLLSMYDLDLADLRAELARRR